MDKLKICAIAFKNLLNIQYKIILGRKGKTTELVLAFNKKDFYHLVGLHKLEDLPYLKKDRGVIFDYIMEDKITYEMISRSSFFETDKESDRIGIRERIEYFIHIEKILESNNLVFKFNKSKDKWSKIEAEYIFENQDYENILYIFIDKCTESQNKHCRSFFPKYEKDYTKNQTKMALLYKEKIDLTLGMSTIQLNKLQSK